MKSNREDVVAALRARGHHDQAIRAACSLPRQVDSEKDAGVLRQLDIGEDTMQLCLLRE